MQLDFVKTDTQRALHGRDEGRADPLHVGFGDFARRVPAFAEGDWRGGNRRPRVSLGFQRGRAFPGALG